MQEWLTPLRFQLFNLTFIAEGQKLVGGHVDLTRFCGVHLLAYLKRDELAKLGRENAFERPPRPRESLDRRRSVKEIPMWIRKPSRLGSASRSAFPLPSHRTNSRLASRWLSSMARTAMLVALLFFSASSLAQAFIGLESKTLAPVSQDRDEWGLKIVVFDVGQADAILLLAPNGDAAFIDTGKTAEHADNNADYLLAVRGRRGSKGQSRIGCS